jgi:RNA polymerase sigma factor (TIGR02999 family)
MSQGYSRLRPKRAASTPPGRQLGASERLALGNRHAACFVYSWSVSDVTRILDRVQQGEGKAAEELLPLVYEQLRTLAARKMAHEAPGQTLQPTALVHEAWLRLVGSGGSYWDSRGHFFAAAAEAMRRILIDVARRKSQIRHGGEVRRVDLEGTAMALSDDRERLIQIHEVLDELAAVDPMKAQVVKLRFFVGLNNREIAELLGVSERTVERAWSFAQAWLFAAIKARRPR